MDLKRSRKALVIGAGSIGQRHARILADMGCQVAIVSRRDISYVPRYDNLQPALKHWQPDYVVIANRTSEHFKALEELAHLSYSGNVLVEKPLFDSQTALPPHNFSEARVAYNLRCHPLLIKLKSLLDDATQLVTANIFVVSYLPDWRPNTDYRQSYSAKSNQGGGVLRDLSHELDYALWLFGPWRWLTASGGRLGPLEIDSDDAYTLLMETQRCPLISIHMNYLDRIPRREIFVNTNQHTVRVDLINNTIAIDGLQESVTVAHDDTYLAEHQAMMSGKAEGLCSLGEAMETLATIEAAERAAALHIWVTR